MPYLIISIAAGCLVALVVILCSENYQYNKGWMDRQREFEKDEFRNLN